MADPDGVLQMGFPAPAVAASLSRARNAREGEPATTLRACRSLTSSDMSMSTALGRNTSRSRHRRLEKAVLSAVSPCLTTATVLPSGSVMAASMGMARYHRKRNEKRDIGNGRGESVDHGCGGIEPLHEESPPPIGYRAADEQLVDGHALVAGQAVQPCGREAVAPRRGNQRRGMGDGCDEAVSLHPIDRLVDRSPRPAR